MEKCNDVHNCYRHKDEIFFPTEFTNYNYDITKWKDVIIILLVEQNVETLAAAVSRISINMLWARLPVLYTRSKVSKLFTGIAFN